MRKNFIDTDYQFYPRGCIFFISRRAQLVNKAEFSDALDSEIDNEERQRRLQKLVERFRPELAGCIVWAFNFDLMRQEWQIAVQHGSLPSFETAAEPPREPLIPETWRDREALL